MLTYTALRDKIESNLRATSGTPFSAPEIDEDIADALREVAQYSPYERMETYTIESRNGTASGTTAGSLVDATKSQFVSGDVGKVVFNKTDRTWALIKTVTSTSAVVLSKDIMVSGDSYVVYNKGCTSEFQINIEDVTDYIEIASLEYPLGQRRNYGVMGTILTIKKDSMTNSKAATSGENQPNTEVNVWFKVKHRVSQLTDLLGVVNNVGGYSEGDTSMDINGLQTSGAIKADQEFTIANTRGVYRVTTNADITSNAATITFYPGLESDVDNSVVVTFEQSTLTNPLIELYVVEYATALAAIREPMLLYQRANAAITTVGRATTAISAIAARITQAVLDVGAGRAQAALAPAAILLASTEFDLMNTQVDLAVTALNSGSSLLNEVPVAGGAPEYMAQANSDIGAAQGFFSTGQSYLQEASVDTANARTYLGAAAGEVQSGIAKIREAQANLQEVSSELQIASSGRIMETWGRTELERVKAKLRGSVPNKYKTSQVYTRE